MYVEQIARDKVGRVIISTIKPNVLKFYGEYETALVVLGKENEEDYQVEVVNSYETKEDALDGHNKISAMGEEELLLFKETQQL